MIPSTSPTRMPPTAYLIDELNRARTGVLEGCADWARLSDGVPSVIGELHLRQREL